MNLTLETERLILRPLEPRDGPLIETLAGAEEIARFTLLIPHPYPRGAAQTFIASTHENADAGVGYTFGIVRKHDDQFVGIMLLGNEQTHRRGELGYWIGVPYWSQGYATESARRILRFGFENLNLNRIYAYHFAANQASGRVMQKIGMQYEGTLRQNTLKWGVFNDSVVYGITHDQWKV